MIDKLSFLKGVGEGGGVSPDEERLMQLFQNRAGLKKAYADLKDEFHLLRDRLKQQEGATIRVQEQLDALGELLGDANTGFGALVFFQLRGLWKTCHQQLSGFAADLTRTQEARETAKHTADCEAARTARLADVDQRCSPPATAPTSTGSNLAGAQTELARLTAFWHYFEAQTAQQGAGVTLRQAVVVADAAVGELHAERSAIGRRGPRGISRHLARRTPQHQPGHHQLRRASVREGGHLRTRRQARRRRWRGAFTK